MKLQSPGPVDTTVPCPLRAEARVVGTSSADEVGDTLRLEVSAVIKPAGCNVSGTGGSRRRSPSRPNNPTEPLTLYQHEPDSRGV